jgi:AcrR family transcriptional regulator
VPQRGTSKKVPRKVPLSRPSVVLSAVTLADAHGIKAVSMRRLAEELGVVPMAIYKHVANKDELLDGMIDLVYSEIEFRSGGSHWKTAMRQRARSMREALLRHPWAIGLMDFRTTPGPANLQHHNAVLERLHGAGFSIRMAFHAYSAINSYIYGSLILQQSLSFETPGEFEQVVETALPPQLENEYPYLAEVLSDVGKRGINSGKEFEFGLTLVLDAIQRFGSRSRRSRTST